MLRIFFLYATGCPACEEAMPDFKQFATKHPEIESHCLDVTTFEWAPNLRYSPNNTPAYVIHRPKQAIIIKEGGMTLEELDEWFHIKLQEGV